eukprot:Nk52_evm1s298 gene=Nk52_evmTU1s298
MGDSPFRIRADRPKVIRTYCRKNRAGDKEDGVVVTPAASNSREIKSEPTGSVTLSRINQCKEQKRALFPIFLQQDNGDWTKRLKISEKKTKKPVCKSGGKFGFGKSEKSEQLYLDFGQKDIGHITCSVCHMVYTKGEEEDEQTHVKFHKNYLKDIEYPVYQGEHVVLDGVDGVKIVRVTENQVAASSKQMNKLNMIRAKVDKELGFIEEGAGRRSSQVWYIYVNSNRQICGIAIVENIEKAYRVLQNKDSVMYDETKPEDAICGVSRIWVPAKHRTKGIATRILDFVREDFLVYKE